MILIATAARTADPWAVHIHYDVLIVVGALVAGYLVAIHRLGPRLAPPGAPSVTRRQGRQFTAGAVLMFVFAFWPIHDIAEDFLFSVHMIQHTAFSLVMTPLLLLGTPAWLLSWIIRPVLPVMQKLVRPVPATLLFNGFIAISHATFWVNYTVTNEPGHFAAHLLLVVVSAVMWLPVVHRLSDLPTMSHPVKMGYLFLQSVLPNVPTAFLVFAETGVYSWYVAAPRVFGISVIDDQQIAGAIMKVGGTMIIWSTIVVMFFRWYKESERDKGDILMWEDVERELARSTPPTGD